MDKIQYSLQKLKKSSFPPDLLELIMKTHPMGKIQTYQKVENVQKNYEIYMPEGFGMFWLKNASQREFISQLKFSNMEGLKFRKPFRGNEIELKAKPSTEVIALVNCSYSGFSLEYQEGYLA
eukprot:TRINITY_DN552_c0_g2_i2.p1 TRINITY_DN552_c0_g2~~TRINITY_DN552_c0_g2_i2.p1  ORF type:complete len:122 (-),score=18.19 TRINITY_DN552_c0_g2_i2:61-426(-)